MLIESNYDAALWFILKADKKNRKDIIEFINELPSELIDNIKATIDDARKHYTASERDKSIPTEVKGEDNIVYRYELTAIFGLIITKFIDNEEVFKLFLSPLYVDDIKLFDNYDDEWIGTLSNSGLCEDRDYSIIKTPLGYFVSYNKELFNDTINFPVAKLVNIDSLPGDVTLESINSMKLRLFK